MLDTSKAKWDFSKEEKYAIDWFNQNGFDGAVVKQHVSKTLFTVSKGGVSDNFELSQGVTNMPAYMKNYEKNFAMLCELKALKAQL